MKYSVDKQERYTVFTLLEENVNSLVAPDLKSEFVFLSNEGIKNLILDITAVKYIDSSGLSSILTAHRLWERLGTFVITGVNSTSVTKLFEISRLDDVLVVIPSLSEAIDYVFMDELAREIGVSEEE